MDQLSLELLYQICVKFCLLREKVEVETDQVPGKSRESGTEGLQGGAAQKTLTGAQERTEKMYQGLGTLDLRMGWFLERELK